MAQRESNGAREWYLGNVMLDKIYVSDMRSELYPNILDGRLKAQGPGIIARSSDDISPASFENSGRQAIASRQVIQISIGADS